MGLRKRKSPPRNLYNPLENLVRIRKRALAPAFIFLNQKNKGLIRASLGCVADLRIDSWTKRWVPSPECILPLFVEYARSDLKQKMCSALAPPHLLAFYHPLSDNLIDC